MYSFTGQMEKAEYYRLMRQHSKSQLAWDAVLTVLTIGISFQFDLALLSKYWGFSLILGLIIFFIYVILSYRLLLVFRWQPQAELALLPKEYRMTEGGLAVRNERREVRLKWTEVEKVKDSQHTLTLYSRHTGPIAIPYRFFASDSQREEVVTYVRQKTVREGQ